jgi:hypothetical protein
MRKPACYNNKSNELNLNFFLLANSGQIHIRVLKYLYF